MFKLLDETEAKTIKGWPVTINIPGDNGAVTKAEIKADFLLLPQSEVDDLIAAARNGDEDADLLRKVLVGFSGVADAGGNPIDFSEASRDRLLNISYARSALVQSYFKAAGGNRPKRGN